MVLTTQLPWLKDRSLLGETTSLANVVKGLIKHLANQKLSAFQVQLSKYRVPKERSISTQVALTKTENFTLGATPIKASLASHLRTILILECGIIQSKDFLPHRNWYKVHY